MAAESLGYPLERVPALVAGIVDNKAASLGLSSADLRALLEASKYGWADAFRVTWLATIPFGVIACILAMLVTDPSPYFTNHTAISLEKDSVSRQGKQLAV